MALILVATSPVAAVVSSMTGAVSAISLVPTAVIGTSLANAVTAVMVARGAMGAAMAIAPSTHTEQLLHHLRNHLNTPPCEPIRETLSRFRDCASRVCSGRGAPAGARREDRA